jgi:CRP-like cAMP-binding protein
VVEVAAPVELLRRVELFAGLHEAELTELACLAQERRANRGAPVSIAGSRASGFFVIGTGTATVSVHGQLRRRLGPGEHFGELALIDGGRRSADITADSDMEYYGLSERAFRSFLMAHPQVMWQMLERVVALLRECQARELSASGASRLRVPVGPQAPADRPRS